jgi:fatty acid CoA ligase FadD9
VVSSPITFEKSPVDGDDPIALLFKKFTRLVETDPQVRDALPIDEIAALAADAEVPIGQILETIRDRYADRPAIGMRRHETWIDPATGQSVRRLLPEFQTMTYGQLWEVASAIASEWVADPDDPCAPGDFVTILGFSGPDYMILDLASMKIGAVVVPLPLGSPPSRLASILDDTAPLIVAAGADYLHAAVDAILLGHKPRRVVVFDYDERIDAHRGALADARDRLSADLVRITTIGQVRDRGRQCPPAPVFLPAAGENPLRSLTYTSGSTGSPKGVMFTEKAMRLYLVPRGPLPMITLSYLPMSHSYGRGSALAALAHGGTVNYTGASDMSTLLEDLAMVRPTLLTLVPRVAELLYQQYLRDAGVTADPEAERAAKERLRDVVMGGRVLSVMCGSAPLPQETEDFLRSALECHFYIGYGGTEMGSVLVDGVVQRPPVIDYRLVDVSELGYFTTDQPYPRGELQVKTESFMDGYYKQPELTVGMLTDDGYYKTNDIMAEIGPDRLAFVERRNNVVKLAQGEFVTVSNVEASLATGSSIEQIYLYADSRRSYLVGVVVPSAELRSAAQSGSGADEVKATIRSELQQIAAAHRLTGYEIPRDFIVETVPFTQHNGLLGGAGKLQRVALEAHYRDRLDALYAALEAGRLSELQQLRVEGAAADPRQTLARAVQATLGITASDVKHDSRFIDIGGDSLAALNLSNLLHDIYDVEVPVGAIIDPASNLDQLAGRIARQLDSQHAQPTFTSVHGDAVDTVRAADLTLAAFIDDRTLSAVSGLQQWKSDSETVLLTGATGFLGRRMAIDLLRRAAETGGRVVCIARGVDVDHARQRIESGLDTDPELISEFHSLSDHLEVIAGDIGEPRLGIGKEAWDELTQSVDRIVHVGAHVNHVLPYRQLFAPNVAGTAELIRLALSNGLKPIDYISTIGVRMLADHDFGADTDVRIDIPTATLSDSYGTGYAASKWAAEVLLHEAADIGLPVTVFRSGMILADRRFAGQLNVPDIFSRLLFTILATGIAPATFYAANAAGGRPRATYSAVTVDALSAAITALLTDNAAIRTYNVDPGHDNGISLDTMVDWMREGGRHITLIDDYDEWVRRCQTAMSALPPAQRTHSLREVMAAYRYPGVPTNGPTVPSDTFRAVLEAAGVELPALSKQLIDKYVDDLNRVGLLR